MCYDCFKIKLSDTKGCVFLLPTVLIIKIKALKRNVRTICEN
jgi:hypothetical protein